MPVAVLLAVLALGCAGLLAQQAGDKIALDIFLFNQEDDDAGEKHQGGNPILNEEFLYVGVRASGRFKVSNVIRLRPTFGISTIEPGSVAHAPDTITNGTDKLTNATTTSASATNFTVSGIMEIKPVGSDWTYSPGAFFSYQPTYVSRGLDFSLGGELFGGNTALTFSYGVRWDSLTGGNLRVSGIFGGGLQNEDGFNGFDRKLHNRYSHNLQVDFTQIISPEWRLNAGFQYTRQDGYLAEPNAQVTIYDGDTPVKFSDERLPNYRNRFQFNQRVRYSPVLNFAFGMDHAVYIDDWGIGNVAVEPNIEGNFGREDARWRTWYRVSYQQGTRYLRERPQRTHKFQTDDPDLGTFNTHNGGVLFLFDMPETGDLKWILRISAYGMYRSDHIWGYGALIGSEFEW
jgi:hypothetical protein